MLLEGILEATSANKIIFRINQDSQGYQQVLFENGSLVIQCTQDRFWTNVDQISSLKIETILPSEGLPVVVKKNIRDNVKKMEESLKKIEKVFGVSVVLEVKFEEVYESVKDESYRSRLGEIIYDSYLKEIVSL